MRLPAPGHLPIHGAPPPCVAVCRRDKCWAVVRALWANIRSHESTIEKQIDEMGPSIAILILSQGGFPHDPQFIHRIVRFLPCRVSFWELASVANKDLLPR
jgi:hypothetical protein